MAGISGNGCSTTSPRAAACRAAKSFATSAMARREVAALSFPSASMLKAVWLPRRAIVPTFQAKSTSCCSPWRLITPRRHFGWHPSVDDHRRAEAALRESERQLYKARDDLEAKVAERTAEWQRSEADWPKRRG